jgi:hypothetical protein
MKFCEMGVETYVAMKVLALLGLLGLIVISGLIVALSLSELRTRAARFASSVKRDAA